MKIKILVLLVLCIGMSACKSDDDANFENQDGLILKNPFPNLSFTRPIDIQNAGDGTDRLFVVEKRGVIQVFNNEETAEGNLFLSISGNVNDQGEQGLLGLAFHPNFATNGYFYVYYNPTSNMSRIARFKVSDTDMNVADPNSEFVLLEFFQDATNHNGGQLTFGPDGYLYISSGDGGPSVNAQDLNTLTGNILRIDVDNPDVGLNYGIPSDNPFVNDANARNEIYAYGLRNPWRMSFDRETGLLWAGDVGAGSREEIDIIEKGANYGWDLYEGTICRTNPCDPTGLTSPIFEYDRDTNGGSVTGGNVYRGNQLSVLAGKYIYGDFVQGKIWALDASTLSNELLFDIGGFTVSAFGVDEQNELYVCNYASGVIYRIEEEQ